ncbi:MAG TPA: hypothetical protein C5S51_00350, partial [Methanosarcinaceae archaeon]|nr:hypothetical protein [Methanosarcinaceae archaeon]
MSIILCRGTEGVKTDAKNDATARSAACFYTMNVKYKTVFKRRHICRYENCIVGFWVMGYGFGSSGIRRLRRKLMF